VNLHIQFDFDAVSLNENILPHIRGDAWFQEAEAMRIINELVELKERMDRFDDEKARLIQEFVLLLGQQARLLSRPISAGRTRGLAKLGDSAFDLKRWLQVAYRSFLRRSYKPYLPPETGCVMRDALVREMRNNLVNRFESVIKPDVEQCLGVHNAFIRRCQET